MRRVIALLLLCLAAALVLWILRATPLAEVMRPLGRWLLQQQASFQNGLALELRGLAIGGASWQGIGALSSLLGICLAYGFLHAAGPGHGKAVLAGYAAARPMLRRRIIAIGLASALGQSLVAILLAVALASFFTLNRASIDALDQTQLAPLASLFVLLIGLWLLFRAARSLRRPRPEQAPPSPRGPASMMLAAQNGGPAPQAQAYCVEPDCLDCGRPHLPDARAIAHAQRPFEAFAIIAAIAIRPCSGALMLLFLSWQMGLLWVGILGTLAMGLGTAGVTVSLALASHQARRGVMRGLATSRSAPLGAAIIEAVTGLLLILSALALASTLPVFGA